MFNKCLDLIYPPTCLHCKEGLCAHAIFCPDCLTQFTLLSDEGRCQKCFAEIDQMKGTCPPCRKKRHPYKRLASCFENHGPAQTLLSTFWKHKEWGFAKELASYLVVQLDQLAYPPPDLITFVPELFSSAPKILSREVSLLLSLPLVALLGRHIRPEPAFFFKNRCNIVGKSVLLISMETSTRQTITNAASTLQEGEPETIFGITLCAS